MSDVPVLPVFVVWVLWVFVLLVSLCVWVFFPPWCVLGGFGWFYFWVVWVIVVFIGGCPGIGSHCVWGSIIHAPARIRPKIAPMVICWAMFFSWFLCCWFIVLSFLVCFWNAIDLTRGVICCQRGGSGA